MYVVQCYHGCGTWLPTAGIKPALKECGRSYCAYHAWLDLAEKHGVSDFHEW